VSGLGVDDGLVRRIREAAGAIVWTTARARRRDRPARVARLGEEEARVETVQRGRKVTVEVTSGPVGAVVLLMEADRRGTPSSLGARNARAGGAFPDGSIVAAWGGAEVPADSSPTVRDLVDLARYALR
jgi:hypothetical protein